MLIQPSRLREQVLAVRELGFWGFCLFEWSSHAKNNLGVFPGCGK